MPPKDCVDKLVSDGRVTKRESDVVVKLTYSKDAEFELVKPDAVKIDWLIIV